MDLKKLFTVFVLFLAAVSAVFAQNKKAQVTAGTSIEAQLQQNLDVKNSRVGDAVVLKVSKAIKQNGETVIPKGANLIGRITDVQQKNQNNGSSRLTVLFDRIQGKNLDLPVTANIVSITNAVGNAKAGDLADADVMGSSNSSGNVSGGNSGGGLLGGVGNTVGTVAGTATNTVGAVTETAGRTVGGTTQTLGRTINGIQISQSVGVSASGSTTLSSNNKNLKLDKGVTFNLLLNESVEK